MIRVENSFYTQNYFEILYKVKRLDDTDKSMILCV